MKPRKMAQKTRGSRAAGVAIEELVRPQEIAEKLRSLRLHKSMGLAQLAEHTGLSAAMLSRLENGRLVPTLPTLARIAMVFNVGLDYFFTDPHKRYMVAISRRGERRQFPADLRQSEVAYHFESLDYRAHERKMSGYLAHFHALPAGKAPTHSHVGVELLYLIEGELEIAIGTDVFQLGPGDAIHFDAVQKHAYRSLTAGPCTAVVAITLQSW